MAKIHYFQRYSTKENSVTNNTLQLLARVYSYSPSQASKLLTNITGESIEIGIEINQQVREQTSVPDGTIIQRSFKVLIESKVASGVDNNQLLRHASSFQNESQKVLLLLTKLKIKQEQEEKIKKMLADCHAGIIFKNVTFEELCVAIDGLFKEFEPEMQALTEDFIEYCNDSDLFDQSKYLMRISPCGVSVDINRKYGIYFHPSDRGYTNHSFVGIYEGKRVQFIWAIDSIFDVKYNGEKLETTAVGGRDTNEYDSKIIRIIKDAKEICGYEIGQGHRFFCGKEVFETDYQKISSGGIQGARYVNLKDKIGEFSNLKDIAEKLKQVSWE